MGGEKRLFNGNKYNITNSSSNEDSSGRFKNTSTLTMPVTENDGGIIRCKAGSSSKDAYLTVLSKFQHDTGCCETYALCTCTINLSY